MRNRASSVDCTRARGARPRSVEPIDGLLAVMREEYRKYEFVSETDRLSRRLDRKLAAPR